jgi:dTDP-4-amino-4,6-dideoxygalactose transaminase
VIEDAAQAIGAEYEGARAGSLAWCGAFSFFPTKNLGAFGDAGIITTSDDALAEKLRILRVHGGRTKYLHDYVGINSRLDTLQAAILLVKFGHFSRWTETRREHARTYRRRLGGANLTLPTERHRHVYNQFTIRSRNRDDLKQRLAEEGIGSEIYYPLPLHLQNCFAGLGYREGDLPESEAAAREVLSLPIEEGLTEEQLGAVCEAVGRLAE